MKHRVGKENGDWKRTKPADSATLACGEQLVAGVQ